MLSRSHRVPRDLFTKAAKEGMVLHSPFFSLRAINAGGSACRVSVVVSKKVEPTAVGRNTLRRRVYAYVQEAMPRIRPGSVLIFFAKKGSEKLSYKDAVEDIETLLMRSKITGTS